MHEEESGMYVSHRDYLFSVDVLHGRCSALFKKVSKVMTLKNDLWPIL